MDTLKVEVKRAVYEPDYKKIIVRQEFRNVVMFIDDNRIEMTTPTAYKVGMAIAKAYSNLEEGELIELSINNKPLQIFGEPALKLVGKILMSAERADDFQRIH